MFVSLIQETFCCILQKNSFLFDHSHSTVGACLSLAQTWGCAFSLSLSLSLSLLPLSDLGNLAVWVLTTISSSILLASFVLKKTNQTVAKTGKNFVLAKFVVVATNSQLVPTRKSNAMQYQLDGKKGVIIYQKQRCSKFHKWKAQKTHTYQQDPGS